MDGSTTLTADALTRLTTMLEPELRATNQAIVARMESQVELIPQLAAHLVAAGGKRLRPLLTLAAPGCAAMPASGGRARAAGRLRRVHPHRDAAA